MGQQRHERHKKKAKMIPRGTKGVHLAQCARSATIWASGRTRDPYFEILGAFAPGVNMVVLSSYISAKVSKMSCQEWGYKWQCLKTQSPTQQHSES